MIFPKVIFIMDKLLPVSFNPVICTSIKFDFQAGMHCNPSHHQMGLSSKDVYFASIVKRARLHRMLDTYATARILEPCKNTMVISCPLRIRKMPNFRKS